MPRQLQGLRFIPYCFGSTPVGFWLLEKGRVPCALDSVLPRWRQWNRALGLLWMQNEMPFVSGFLIGEDGGRKHCVWDRSHFFESSFPFMPRRPRQIQTNWDVFLSGAHHCHLHFPPAPYPSRFKQGSISKHLLSAYYVPSTLLRARMMSSWGKGLCWPAGVNGNTSPGGC